MATTAARNEASEAIAVTRAARARRPNKPHRLREAWALVAVGAAIFLVASVLTYAVEYRGSRATENICGWVGHLLGGAFVLLLGTAAYIPLAFLAVWSIIFFLRGHLESVATKALGVLVLTAVLSILLEHRSPLGEFPGQPRGGLVGTSLEPMIKSGFGVLGTYLVLGVLGAIAFTMATDFAFLPLLLEATRGVKAATEEVRTRADQFRRVDWGARMKALFPNQKRRVPEVVAAPPPKKEEPPVAAAPPPPPHSPSSPATVAQPAGAGAEPVALPYRLPETKLLDESKKARLNDASDEVQAQAVRIETVLRTFGVDVKVVGYSRGPAVTLFELEMGEGVTVNLVTARRHDLAIRLKAGGVRFVFPIPGKETVGVEIPNTRRDFVRLRELLDEVPPGKIKTGIPLYLGRDVMNRAVVEDLSEMPHLLIAGQTGSGKSACLNAILCSVLLARTPDDVKLILVDPKQVEFSKYDRVPHLMCPIVTVARKVPIVLDWVIAEMEERYTLLAMAGVRKIADFNALPKRELKERMADSFVPGETRLRIPYLVVVVDEMNDLMVQAKKDMEDRITRIAQKSRAVGIHLILATQRPSVNVITGTIKANLPTRIAFQTAQGNDSRVILDQIGAEDLLGKGDFLYKPPGTDKFVRAQGTWVGDEEIDRLVRHARSLAEPSYDIRLVQIREAPDSDGGGEATVEATFESGSKDALFERAVEETIQANRAAASHLQRAFAIGYNRATRILDAMASLGIVSSYEGSKVRRILITAEEWAAKKAEILRGDLRERGKAGEAGAEE